MSKPSQKTLVVQPERRRRSPLPVPVTDPRKLPKILTKVPDITEHFRQKWGEWDQVVDLALQDRWVINLQAYRLYAKTGHDECETGLISEQVIIIRELIAELAAGLGCYAVYKGDLLEANEARQAWPAGYPVKTPAALRESLERRVPELYGRLEETAYGHEQVFGDLWNKDPKYHFDDFFRGDWPLVKLDRRPTDYGSWGDGAVLVSPREFLPAALTEALQARRWPGLAILDARRESGSQRLSARLREMAPWAGSLSEMAEAIPWPGSERGLGAELKRSEAQFAAEGLIVRRSGSRTGETRAAEWVIEVRGTLSTLSKLSLEP